tara:strand:- start:622 stop:1638 length:1017 start_codon:yes stop_codon:yes gene_type:complete
MAINVNTVYTTVLSILNKEQRGYLTPYEFNQLATQVQLETFENFFEDYNQYIRMPKTDVEFASRMDHIHQEFQLFEKTADASAVSANIYTQPTDLHRFGSAFYTRDKGVTFPEIEIVSAREYTQQTLSPLTQPSFNFPIAKYQQDKLIVYPEQSPSFTGDVSFNYIRKPLDVRWGYSVGSLGQFLYDSTVYDANALINGNTLSNFTTPLSFGTPGTYTPTFTTTNASPGSFAISANVTSATAVTITITNPGSGFVAGDTVTINASQLGLGSFGPVITLLASDFMSGSTYGSIDFEISSIQQTDVILKILQYAGVIIRDPSIIQAAQQELMQDQANEKR